MTEPHERNPLSGEVARHLRAVTTTEISPLDKRIGILLGTGIELLGPTILNGRLKEFSSQGDRNPHTFVAIATQGLIPRLLGASVAENAIDLLFDPEETRFRAIRGAGYTAKIPYFLSQLGLPLDDADLQEMAIGYLTQKDPLEKLAEFSYLTDYVKPELVQKIPTIAESTKERKGFLLGININAPFTIIEEEDTKNVVPHYGNPYGPDLLISFGPLGMPYKDIVVIEALGPAEKDFLKNL